MSFEAFSTIALSDNADRGASCIGDDGIWYAVNGRANEQLPISRISIASNTSLPDIPVKADANVNQRSLNYLNDLLYIGTYTHGIWSLDPTSNNRVNVTPFSVAEDISIASAKYAGKIHYFCYSGSYYLFDPANPLSLSASTIPGDYWVAAEVYGNQAFVLGYQGNSKLVNLDTRAQVSITTSQLNHGNNAYKAAGTSNGKLFIPQIGSNQLHVFDWESKTVLPSLTLPANVNAYAVVADEEEVRVLYQDSYVSVDPVNMTVNPTPVALPVSAQWHGVSYAANGDAYVGALNGSKVLFAASDYVPPPTGPTSKIWNGEEWVESQPKVIWNGSSWQPIAKVEVSS